MAWARDASAPSLTTARATGWFRPVELERPLVIYGVHGGAEWTGAAFDPERRLLFVTSNNLPWFLLSISMR